MIEGGIGGANTGTGLEFERNADFKTLILEQADYSIRKCEGEAGEGVFYQGKKVARCFKKHSFQKNCCLMMRSWSLSEKHYSS